MRSVALARTLGVGSWAALSAPGSHLGNALGEAAGASSARLQHTKAQAGGSSDPEAGAGPKGQIPDPFDLEYDRFNGGAMADALGAAAKETIDLRGRPVDLEYELDRDDPEAVDLQALYSEEEMSPDEEDELLGREVDLDDEYDLMHDHVVAVVEPGPSEGKGPTAGTQPGFEAIKDAASGAVPTGEKLGSRA